jgi:hypothetical protein
MTQHLVKLFLCDDFFVYYRNDAIYRCNSADMSNLLRSSSLGYQNKQ